MAEMPEKVCRAKLEEMLAELRAINLWDRNYTLQKAPSFIETAAWQARRRRVSELTLEFLEYAVRSFENDREP